MITVQKLVLHLIDICSLVQKTKTRFQAGRSRFLTGRSRFLSGRPRFLAGKSRFVAGRKNNKNDVKRGARADNRQGLRTKEDISEKKSGQTL